MTVSATEKIIHVEPKSKTVIICIRETPASRDGISQDDNLVTWNDTEDPDNPKNWSLSRKWITTVIISTFVFLAPLSSSMSAPALSDIAEDLHISSAAQTNLVLSIFLLAYAFGPFFFSACSEIWGRRLIVQTGNLFFLVFNTACGFSTSQAQLVTFRFLAGLGGSATIGIGSGVMADCWRISERGRGMSIYQLAPVLGPALAPIAGGFITLRASWRWTFWSVSCLSVLVQAMALLFLKETYEPRILAIRAERLRRETKNPNLRTKWEHKTLSGLLRISFTRPWRILLTQPIVQILGLYQAFTWGMLYLIISSLPTLWEGRYGLTKDVASLHYLSLLGSLVASQLCGPITDYVQRLQRKRHAIEDGIVVPEFRMPLAIPASVLTAGGIFLFGWSAEAKLFWLLPDIGVALFAGSSLICYLCISMYLTDTYNQYAASASAASTLLRSLAAFSFPLFAPSLFQTLGYGRGCSVLGSIALCLGVPAPILLWKFGSRIRNIRPFGDETT